MASHFPFWPSVAASQLVGLVFLLAAAGKLADRERARRGLAAYAILPERAVGGATVLLVSGESIVAVCLLTGIGGAIAPSVALGLVLVFSAVQIVTLSQRREVPCGCFGSLSSRPVSWTSVGVNLGLAACCCLAISAFIRTPDVHWGTFLLYSKNAATVEATHVGLIQAITTIAFAQALALKQVLDNHLQYKSHLRYMREQMAALAVFKLGRS